MLRQGPLPAFVHGVLEYLAGILFIAAPFLFHWTSGTAKAVAIVGGVVLLAVTASSAIPTGLMKSIPVPAHVVLDYLIAVVLIASPFIFGFSGDGGPTAFFLVAGVAYLLVTIATRFVRGERPARSGAGETDRPTRPAGPTRP